MSKSSLLSIRLAPEVKQKLVRLTKETKRSASFLAAEAVSRYVETEAEIIEGIKTGLADVKAGRTVSNEEAFAQFDATLARVKAEKSKHRA